MNLAKLTRRNKCYRMVHETTKESQLVLMALLPGETVPMEVHPRTSQFIRVEQGSCVVIINGKRHRLTDDCYIMVPSGAYHEIRSGRKGVKLYTIYSPPEHKPCAVQIRQHDHEVDMCD